MNELQIKQNPIISIDDEIKAFDLIQRKAKALSTSKLVPKIYQNNIADCIVAIDMATRMNANYLMVMQNLTIIQGHPSWSSQWIIASINNCGKYTSLKFEIQDLGIKEVDYIEYVWNSKIQEKEPITNKTEIHDFSCIAYAIEKSTNERLESSKVTVEMAVKEGWYTKAGSKWQTMTEVMLRYRAASFFGKIYAPELLMGLQSIEENQDIAHDLSIKYPNAIENSNLILNTDKPSKFKPKKQVEAINSIENKIVDDNLNENIVILSDTILQDNQKEVENSNIVKTE
jgi:hypothetical protein